MDWFERLTGFRETNYDDTRAKLAVDGSRLRSLINGRSYAIGELELVRLPVHGAGSDLSTVENPLPMAPVV